MRRDDSSPILNVQKGHEGHRDASEVLLEGSRVESKAEAASISVIIWVRVSIIPAVCLQDQHISLQGLEQVSVACAQAIGPGATRASTPVSAVSLLPTSGIEEHCTSIVARCCEIRAHSVAVGSAWSSYTTTSKAEFVWS